MKTRSVYLAGVLCVVAATTLAISADQRQDQQELSKQLQKLTAERVKTATSAFEATDAAYNADTIGLPQLLATTQTLAQAEAAAAVSQQESIAALQRHARRNLEIERKVEALYKAGVGGGEAEKYYTAKLARETADIDLLKAKLSLAKAE